MPTDPVAPPDVAASLVRTANLISDVCAAAASAHDLSVQQATLLCAIADRPLTTMAELGQLLRISRSSTTELVDRAEHAGIVRRVPDTRDRRQQVVLLTPQGDRLGETYRARVREEIDRLLEALDPDERGVLWSITSRVVVANHARATWPSRVGAS